MITPLAFGLAVVLAGCGTDAETSSGTTPGVSEAQTKLYESAVEAGGVVTVFIGSTGTDELTALGDAFNEQFPDVEVEYVTGTSEQTFERFMTERRSGLSNADVLALAGVRTYEAAQKEGFLEKFTPQDADLFTHDAATYVDGLVYGFSDIQVGACYNPNNVTDDEIKLLETPHGWSDPVWKGRAAIVNTHSFGNQRGMLYWVYEDSELGEDWLKNLAELDPVVYGSANTAAPQVIAGEHDVLFNSLTIQAPRALRQGAPLRCTTGPYAPAYPYSVALPSKAPNSAAGKLFINWLLSEAGQTAVQETLGYNAHRKGFDTPVVEDESWKTPDDIRFVDEDLAVEHGNDLSELFDGLFDEASD